VVPIDEFRSSVTCSSCHKRLKKSQLFTKMQRKEDEADIRTKEQPSKKEAKEIAEMRKFHSPTLASKKIALKCTWNVLRCSNSRCKATFWNRDVNAARNMLELLRSGLKGKLGASGLQAFRRDSH
jgi:transposase